MPYSTFSWKTYSWKNYKIRQQLYAAHKRWEDKAKALNSPAWQHRKEAKRIRSKKYFPKQYENRKQLRIDNPEKERRYIRKYRLKAQEKAAGRAKPDYCEVCLRANVRIVFDHCHKTGAFRGWICYRCNNIMGLIDDDVSHLRKLITYLAETKAPSQAGASPMY